MTRQSCMRPFTRHRGRLAPLPHANVDTDQIIPARFLHRARSTGFADVLFHDLRAGEGTERGSCFVLDEPAHAGASILVAGTNFGCGSSREQAVWALADAGFRVVIAPSLGDIFRANALQNGLLALTLPEATVARLMTIAETEPQTGAEVDLQAQTITAGAVEVGFEIDSWRKEALMQGLSETAMTLSQLDRIERFEQALHTAQPWLRSPFVEAVSDPASHPGRSDHI